MAHFSHQNFFGQCNTQQAIIRYQQRILRWLSHFLPWELIYILITCWHSKAWVGNACIEFTFDLTRNLQATLVKNNSSASIHGNFTFEKVLNGKAFFVASYHHRCRSSFSRCTTSTTSTPSKSPRSRSSCIR